jgi:hypothetical protein
MKNDRKRQHGYEIDICIVEKSLKIPKGIHQSQIAKGQKKTGKRINNDEKKTTQKTKDRAIRTS